MDDSGAGKGGFTVLDGVALVAAAAVASVHMLGPVGSASGAAWGLVWIAFAGVALTSAGPILYLSRHYGRRIAPEGGLGERLWALLGAPWIVTAPLRSPRVRGADPRALGLYGTGLTLTLGAACVVVLAVLWKSWVLTPPQSRFAREGPSPWTQKVGMALSVAWPLQCGFLLVVLDSEGLPPSP